MIILTEQQKDFLIEFKIPYQDLLSKRNVDFVPIQIKPFPDGTNRYILPENLLTDDNFSEIRQALQDGGHLQNMITGEITNDDLLPTPLI